MNHPEVILVPLLFLADYFLTVFGAILKEKKYDEFFKTEQYELNPVWQHAIGKKKWFNPRLLGWAVLLAGFLVSLEFANVPNEIIHGFVACFVLLFGATIGRHLSNILTFRRLIKKSDDISGQITMSHALVLTLSLYQSVAVVVPVVLLVIFYPSPALIGAFIGSLLLFAIHLGWIRRYKKKVEASNKPVNTDK
jgi:hypothetical protein